MPPSPLRPSCRWVVLRLFFPSWTFLTWNTSFGHVPRENCGLTVFVRSMNKPLWSFLRAGSGLLKPRGQAWSESWIIYTKQLETLLLVEGGLYRRCFIAYCKRDNYSFCKYTDNSVIVGHCGWFSCVKEQQLQSYWCTKLYKIFVFFSLARPLFAAAFRTARPTLLKRFLFLPPRLFLFFPIASSMSNNPCVNLHRTKGGAAALSRSVQAQKKKKNTREQKES